MFTLPAKFNRLKGAVLLLFISLFSFASSTAQAQALTIGSVQACAAGEVLVPVTGTGLSNIGSLTIFITFDSTSLVYGSVENIDSQLKDALVYAFNHNPFQLAIVWSGIVPANLDQKKLFDIRFTLTGSVSAVTFKTNCEVSDINLNILAVTYNNGNIVSGSPQIVLQPHDTLVKPWGNTEFKTIATNAISYLWKESIDNGQTWSGLVDNNIFQGTHTSTLMVKKVPPSYNNFRYSCSLSAEICPVSTTEAILRVDSILSVPGVNGISNIGLQVRPNPFSDVTFIDYTLVDGGMVYLEILDIYGNVTARPLTEAQLKGFHSIRFDASELSMGLYFCKLIVRNEVSTYSTCRKVIKQNN